MVLGLGLGLGLGLRVRVRVRVGVRVRRVKVTCSLHSALPPTGMPCSASLAEMALEIEVKCTSAAPCPASGAMLPISPNWQKRSVSCLAVVSSEIPAT